MNKHTPVITYQAEWEQIPFTIYYYPQWLSFISYVEIIAEEALPISETGYRSLYRSQEAIEASGGIRVMVQSFMESAARCSHWQRHQQARRQLSFF